MESVPVDTWVRHPHVVALTHFSWYSFLLLLQLNTWTKSILEEEKVYLSLQVTVHLGQLRKYGRHFSDGQGHNTTVSLCQAGNQSLVAWHNVGCVARSCKFFPQEAKKNCFSI